MKNRFKILNKILIILLLVLTLIYTISDFRSSRILTYIAVIPLIIVPYIFDKIIYKTTDKEKFIYYIFIFLAYFLGSVVNLYNKTEYYDLIIHGVSGIYTMSIAKLIFDNFKIKNTPLIKFLFCFGFVFLVAGLWEIVEYLSDVLFNSNLQHNIETGVADTMSDILSAAICSVIAYFGNISILGSKK